MATELSWSGWCVFNDSEGLSHVPNESGIYEVQTNYEIRRLRGSSPTVTIGLSKSLKNRRQGQKAYNPTKFLNRAEKWLHHNNHVLKFRYHNCASEEEAHLLEAIMLWEYENKHWELPPGNDKLEKKPIVELIASKYQSMENLLNGLHDGLYFPQMVANDLGLSYEIIENLIVYFDVFTRPSGCELSCDLPEEQ